MTVFNDQHVKFLKMYQLVFASHSNLAPAHCWKENIIVTQGNKPLEKDSFICGPPNNYNLNNNSGKDC